MTTTLHDMRPTTDGHSTPDSVSHAVTRSDQQEKDPDPTSRPPAIAGYEILGELGRGGMGVVWKARDIRLKRLVAIKPLLLGPHAAPEMLARFRTEAEALAKLHHPHIVQVFQAGDHDGQPFFVLEYVAGGSLDGKVRGQPQSIAESARMVMLLARAVHAAHRVGVVHRDLKPANVLLAEPGDEPAMNTAWGLPKVTDFGLARQQEGGEERGSVSGMILGTPSYMAPEQAEGQLAVVGAAADVWALGVILYELLAGRLPFRGESLTATLIKVCTTQPEPIRSLRPEVPETLAAVAERCLRKKPEERYSSAAELAEDLKRRLDGDSTPPLGRGTPPRRSRLPLLIAGVVVLAVLAVMGIGLGWGLLGSGSLAGVLLRATELQSDSGSQPSADPSTSEVFTTKPTTRPTNPVVVTKPPPPPAEPIDPSATSPKPDKVDYTAKAVGMHFVNVPRGSFWKGGSGGKPGTEKVTIPYDFQMGVFEVTQEQWQSVTGQKPKCNFTGTHLPVESISWDDIQEAFLPKLNEADKEEGFLYRLPKEAEWEYACRGRASFPGPVDLTQEECSFDFYFGEPTNNLSSADANFDGNSPAGNGPKGEYRVRTIKVGSFQPNRLGIYDLHGNVLEWCDDLFMTTSTGRVSRGGAYGNIASGCRAADRVRISPKFQFHWLGFRVARVPSRSK